MLSQLKITPKTTKTVSSPGGKFRLVHPTSPGELGDSFGQLTLSNIPLGEGRQGPVLEGVLSFKDPQLSPVKRSSTPIAIKTLDATSAAHEISVLDSLEGIEGISKKLGHVELNGKTAAIFHKAVATSDLFFLTHSGMLNGNEKYVLFFRWAVQIGVAIIGLQSKKFVHRDVKPENILITFEGKAELCDFDTTVKEASVRLLLEHPIILRQRKIHRVRTLDIHGDFAVTIIVMEKLYCTG
jgi:serine/threonine protein kinase